GPFTTGSSAAVLTVVALPTISDHPSDLTIVVGASATFTVSAQGTEITYQWQRNNANLSGSGAQTSSYSIPSATLADSGAYRCVVTDLVGSSVTSNPAMLTVIALPVITVHPSPATVGLGSTATFSVTATGTGRSYQWRKNGTNIDGATLATYITPATTMDDNGASFRCVVSTIAGSVISDPAVLTVIEPPTIRTHPASQTVTEGLEAAFEIVAEGVDPTYQWRKNGTPIQGAQSNSYRTPATTKVDNGAVFTCVVTTLGGSDTSNDAILTVHYAPSITAQPESQSVNQGSAVTFTVVADGNPAPSYQWSKDGTPIPGATSASYDIEEVTLGDAGTYTVNVTNSVGNVTSNEVVLIVSVTPVPETPVLSSPANGATDVPLTPTLVWNAATGAESYKLQWSTNPGFGNADSIEVTDTKHTLGTPLSPGVPYRWRVQGINTSGPGDWSTDFTFTTAVVTE
ncbi:MAG: immunoglobulin domain-containing protein, partial [Chitinispirillaceae bacterium]|nr:immunoglobulin domain-containing protein [Chitinispirillaceae bacterium]